MPYLLQNQQIIKSDHMIGPICGFYSIENSDSRLLGDAVQQFKRENACALLLLYLKACKLILKLKTSSINNNNRVF